MPSREEDVQFLKKYQKDLQHFYNDHLPHLVQDDFITPESILSDVPSKKKQNQMLLSEAEHLFSMAKKCKSPARANRLKKFAELLSDSDFRSKRAAKLVARKRKLAELRVKRMDEDTEAANAQAERVARLADENGFDGTLFRNLFVDDDPTSQLSTRRMWKQIETIPRIIAKIEKSGEEGQKVSLTNNETQLIFDMANHPNECRKRLTISTAARMPESTLKIILKAFEKRGWVHRPSGPRSGYTITEEGMQIYRIISPE